MHHPPCSVCLDRAKDCPLALVQKAHSGYLGSSSPDAVLIQHRDSALTIDEIYTPIKVSPQTFPNVTLRQLSQCCTVKQKLPFLKHVIEVVLLSLQEAYFELAAQQSDSLSEKNTEHVESFTHGKIGAFLIAKREALAASKEWRGDDFLLLSLIADFYGVKIATDDTEVR